MKKIAIFVIILSVIVCGCALVAKPIDISHVKSNVVKGKTTMVQIENMYGSPNSKGISKDGNSYYYYNSVNMFTAKTQYFTFYFNKKGKVANYASEYPGGNPLFGNNK